MPYYMYVAAQDDDQIAIFSMDEETGSLAPSGQVSVSGGPSLLAASPDHLTLYVGHRTTPEISSWHLDQTTGGLTKIGSLSLEGPPAFLSVDRTGKYLLSSHYQSGHAAVHAIGDDGAVASPPIEWIATDVGAHALQTDRSNKFAFVPHIARLNDNVLEPPKNLPGPNVIYQYKFDEGSGRLTPGTPPQIPQEELTGPRHYTFHPQLDVAYFSNEQGCSVTAYHLDPTSGSLSPMQTISTVPEGYSERNTCSQIQVSPEGKFLYVPNRGHNSIACFTIDPASGRLTSLGRVATEAVPSAFSLDPTGNFLYAAGSASHQIASYRINAVTGELTPLDTYAVGKRPMWILVTRLGE